MKKRMIALLPQGKDVDAVIDPGIEAISPENAQARIGKVNGYLAELN